MHSEQFNNYVKDFSAYIAARNKVKLNETFDRKEATKAAIYSLILTGYNTDHSIVYNEMQAAPLQNKNYVGEILIEFEGHDKSQHLWNCHRGPGDYFIND